MPAGIKYDMNPLGVEKELWNQATTYRLAGGFNLDDDKLVADSHLPVLAPLAIDFATRKAKAVKNVKVYENAAADATAIKIEKNSLAYVNMYLSNGLKAAQVTAIDKTNAAYDVLTISLGAAVTEGNILFEVSGASANAVKGVYTLTIGTVPAVDDKLTINGIDYVFAAAAAEGKIMIGADKVATAANLQDTVEADNQDFVVKANGAKLVFTQKVAGTGAIPVIVVTQTGGGTLAASIAQTTAGTAGVIASEPLNVANFLNYARVKVEAGATVTAIGQAYEIKESKLTVPVSAKDKVSLGARFLFV
jgi:hypothetical protein